VFTYLIRSIEFKFVFLRGIQLQMVTGMIALVIGLRNATSTTSAACMLLGNDYKQ